MGAPQQREINARISITMRASLIIVSLSCILYAASASQESTVPEDSLFELDDELAEARATVEAMTSDGKSYKDCEKLVTDTKNDITTSVTTNQKIIDALPRGDHCPTVAVQTKKILEQKTKCAATLKISIEQETKASQAQVVFGKSTFSSLKEGDCNTFFTHSSYTSARTTYETTVTTRIKAEGAYKQATETLAKEIKIATKSENECLCKTKADHAAAFKKANQNDAANKAAWTKAHQIGCVLRGETSCRIPPTPSLTQPTLSARAQAAVCTGGPIAEKKAPTDKCERWKAEQNANSEIVSALAKARVDFGGGSIVLTSEGKKTLQNVAKILNKYPWMTMEVRGHSDAKPGATCTRLVDGRAKSSMDYLRSRGATNTMKVVTGTCGKIKAVTVRPISVFNNEGKPAGC